MKRFFIFLSVIIFSISMSSCGKQSNQAASSQGLGSKAATTVEAISQETKAIGPQDIKSPGQFQSFSIYADKGSKDNHFIPSGFMPDGKCLNINDTWVEDCHSGKTCIKIVYDVACSKEGAKWAGVYWQNPANNWGGRKGGFDLTGAVKLTFWAKGEKGGERIEEFKMGGISGDYPDTDSAMIGPVILTPEWKEYTVDLRGKDLSYVSGGFSWAANVDYNQESCIFYLDDLKYE